MKICTGVIAAFSLWAFFTPAHSAESAQSFPSKPIKIVVPYSPGGTTDLLARTIGKHLSETWKQPVIVENKPGVNGMLGSDLVAKSTPDGYTIGIASPGSHAANAGLYPNITYDTIKDFTPVTLAVSAPLVLVAHPSLNVKNVKEVIQLAKAKPGEISYASGGAGSSQHLAMELFNHTANVQMTHVPYKGSAASYVDLIGGRVTLEFDALPSAMPHVKAGKLLALAVASSSRVPFLPDVPTVAESGLPGYESSSWYGIVAPANLPKDILAKLNGEIVTALKKPDIADILTKAGVIVVAGTPEQFSAHIKSEVAKAGKIISAANIKAE
ncbi:MAG: tripartite tricarboxylate transporter substrate binding protein [Oxalobacteraceae bacterium]|nr:MAG: tripartite tricarboxylate transporter substrate binding protein [Oxalobacteraceae bacterium]